MLRAGLKINQLKFDIKDFRKKYEEALYDAMLKVATVWVRTALHSVDGTFPVVTGMARASFIELIEFLRGEGKRIAFNELQGVNFNRVIPGKKSIAEGKRQSKKSNFIVVLKNQYGPFKLTFDWWTNIEHFYVNELDPTAQERFKLIHPTPWNVRIKANEAAEKYLPTVLKQMPKLVDSVKVFILENE